MKRIIAIATALILAFSTSAFAGNYDNMSRQECRQIGRQIICTQGTSPKGYTKVHTQDRIVYVSRDGFGPDFDIPKAEYDSYARAETQMRQTRNNTQRTIRNIESAARSIERTAATFNRIFK